MKAQRYSSILPVTSELERGGWSLPRPGRFTPVERDPVPIEQGGPQGRYGRLGKTSSPPALDPRIFQPVAIRCTDYPNTTRPTDSIVNI